MTYSILARDPATGELGVAVQSRWPMVGAAVPWLEAGVGAVATQAATNRALGPLVLERLRQGRSANEALADALATDPDAEVRQLAVVDAVGRAAVHTGERCLVEAGHATAPNVSAQGNMLAEPGMPAAMLQAFTTGGGDLASRLLGALRAAEEAGGDVRGRQSAALVLASGEAEAAAWEYRFDLRVDDARDPLGELERLLGVARAFEHLQAALQLARAGALAEALAGTSAAHELAPYDGQLAFWHGVVLLACGQAEAGRSLLRRTLRAEPGLVAYATRSAQAEPGSALAASLRAAAALDET
jgi:uncharacterized Ntn-hydrolase superfamily protein